MLPRSMRGCTATRVAVRDFSLVTEHPSRCVGRDTREVISRRYALAARHAIGARVLEVGCGAGFGLGALARRGRWVVGGELTEANLRQTAATYAGRPGISLLQMDAHALPFRDQTFDTVLALAVIYYLNLDVFLRECARVLRPGGAFVFCTSNREAPGFRPSRFSTVYYSLRELEDVMRANMFDVEFFGAFPTSAGRRRVLPRAAALAGTAVDRLPVSAGMREGIKRALSAVAQYERVPLPAELGEDDLQAAEAIPLIPLDTREPASAYRVLYGVAHRTKRRA